MVLSIMRVIFSSEMTFLQYFTVIAIVLTSKVCGIPSGGKFAEDLTITSKSRNKSFAEQVSSLINLFRCDASTL